MKVEGRLTCILCKADVYDSGDHGFFQIPAAPCNTILTYVDALFQTSAICSSVKFWPRRHSIHS
jgi:hypothetical protein